MIGTVQMWEDAADGPVWDVLPEARVQTLGLPPDAGHLRGTSPAMGALPEIPDTRAMPGPAPSKSRRVRKTSYYPPSGNQSYDAAPLRTSAVGDRGGKFPNGYKSNQLARRSTAAASLVQNNLRSNSLVDRLFWLISIMPFFRHWGGFV
jgi:hypothetical protein